jgi:peptidoglycan hydrolase-like protein with peptidoglycan-binding domain
MVAKKNHGQQAIDSDRAREIQTALIRDHYLTGEPTGVWDSATQAAMQRFQSDQGWQSKTIPDSRALIKLGLGPNQDHLLNPESAMTTAPATTPADPKPAAKPTAPGEGVPQQ